MNVTMTAPMERGTLIGREREMERLLAYRREAGEGHGSIVLIGGEAGVGKSRLLRAYTSALEGGRAAVGTGRCAEFVRRPFAPLRESLQELARNAPAIARDAGVERLVERLSFGAPREALGAAEPAAALFETMQATLGKLALRRTIVVLLDDLHWADRSTLAFLAHLAERIAERRILVVATYRSEEVDSDHPQLADFASLLRKRAVSNMVLPNLDASHTRELVERGLSPSLRLDGSMLADIVRRSAGNPFFAEELIKSTREHAGRATRELPLSIRAAILARVDLLDRDERDVLSMASALGERFSVARLASLCGDESRTLAALQHARRLHLVSDEGQPLGQVAFRHALTQEVLYGDLLAERVRPLHETIGRELEAYEDRGAVIVDLAHHFWCAGDAERAARYCEEAGDRARALSAAADAALFYDRALEKRRGDLAAEARLERKVGAALALLGRPVLGTQRLRRAAELYLAVGDDQGYADNALELGVQTYNAGDVFGAIECLRHAIELGTDRVSAATMNRARARMAFSCLAALDVDAALEFAAAADDLPDDPATENRCRQVRSKAYAMQGRFGLWETEAHEALSAAQRIDDGDQALRATHCQIALDAMAFGENEPARQHLEQAVALHRDGRFDFDSLILSAFAQEGTLRGEFADAARMLERAKALPGEEYTTSTHLRTAQLTLGICAGDDALLQWDGAEAFFEYGIAHGMKLVLGLAGGPYAWALALRGHGERARGLIHQIAGALRTPHRFAFAFLAAAQFGAPEDVEAMRAVLVRAECRREDRVTAAVRALFDAYAATRGIVDADASAYGLRAAERFHEVGWPWFAAQALEAAGETQRALAAYETIRALRDIRRLKARNDSSRAEIRVLSPREREVAHLVALAKSNEEIAQVLGISRRTVEKHVAAATEKLNFATRAQLALFLAQKK